MSLVPTSPHLLRPPPTCSAPFSCSSSYKNSPAFPLKSVGASLPTCYSTRQGGHNTRPWRICSHSLFWQPWPWQLCVMVRNILLHFSGFSLLFLTSIYFCFFLFSFFPLSPLFFFSIIIFKSYQLHKTWKTKFVSTETICIKSWLDPNYPGSCMQLNKKIFAITSHYTSGSLNAKSWVFRPCSSHLYPCLASGKRTGGNHLSLWKPVSHQMLNLPSLEMGWWDYFINLLYLFSELILKYAFIQKESQKIYLIIKINFCIKLNKLHLFKVIKRNLIKIV